MAIFDDVQAAVEELKREPSRPVQAHIDDLDVELRALAAGDEGDPRDG